MSKAQANDPTGPVKKRPRRRAPFVVVAGTLSVIAGSASGCGSVNPAPLPEDAGPPCTSDGGCSDGG